MRNKPRKYSEIENEWLKENYPIHGSKYCAEYLNISIEQIRNKIKNLKLIRKEKININLFENINSSEVAYILGLLWADGHISKDGRHICIGLINQDMVTLKDIFTTTGKWNYYLIDMKKYGNYKNQGKLYISNSKLHKILSNYGFYDKSVISPTNLLNNISENIQHYFFRGLCDGDGCFYINKKNFTYQFTLASTFNQDWSYMVKLCDNLKIGYRIDRFNNPNKKYSVFRICKKKDVIIFGDYIYKDFKFGLNRKYIKFSEIKKS